jgi:hypothetical protein
MMEHEGPWAYTNQKTKTFKVIETLEISISGISKPIFLGAK